MHVVFRRFFKLYIENVYDSTKKSENDSIL